MSKIVFLDVDGTLIDYETKLPDSARKAVKMLGKERKEKQKPEINEAVELAFQNMENRMKTIMGTKVNISRKDRSKGKIEIEYYSEAEKEEVSNAGDL